MSKPKANERPGYAVCICDKNGNILLNDPAAWRRAEYQRIKEIERKEREGTKKHEKSNP